MKIQVESIPHNQQRYETCGDWWWNKDTLHIRVSDLGNEDEQFLIAIHEIVEAWIATKRGITEEEVTAFDQKFEKHRLNNTDEPGDDKSAPYRREHFFATNIERLLAHEMEIDWTEYENQVINLDEHL